MPSKLAQILAQVLAFITLAAKFTVANICDCATSAQQVPVRASED